MTSTTSLSSLISGSGAGDDATAAMTTVVDTLGPTINAGLGTVIIDDLDAVEVIIVTEVLDDSSSMHGNAQHARDGHNLVIDSLKASKQQAAVLCGVWTLNRGVLQPYVLLDQAIRLDGSNYNPGGSTPLYDQMILVLTVVATKIAEFEQAGVTARAITFVTTDGADYGSIKKARDVAVIVKGLLATEQHIIAGVGIDDGGTDFRKVFKDMGLLDEWILTPGDSASDIRKAFALVSQSAVRASQTASFSKTAMGGFGTP